MQKIENERQLIAYFADRSKRSQAAREAGEPEVGIFFVYGGKILTSSDPLSVTEPYGKFKSNDDDYARLWKIMQRYGTDQPYPEYCEVPRGRVEYDINEGKFCVYADACILGDQKALDEILREFHLSPANTKEPIRDPHYRCAGCNMPTKEKRKEI